MAERERLPNRRASCSFSFEHRGLGFTCTVSRFADGRIGELFLSNHKVSSHVDIDARDAAIILSFALQHGTDLSAIARALCRNSRVSRTRRAHERHPSSLEGRQHRA